MPRGCGSERLPAEAAGPRREPRVFSTGRIGPGGDLYRRTPARVAIIDEHAFTRQCIALSLQEFGGDLTVVAYANCDELVRSDTAFDLVIYHWQRKGTQEAAFRHLQQITIRQPVVVLSPVLRPRLVLDAFELGVRGYIPTENTTLDLAIEIIRLVKAGGTFVPVSGLPLQDPDNEAQSLSAGVSVQFTPREAAVLDLLKRGCVNRAIADELHISESTVKANLRSIMRKLKVSNRTEAVWRAISTGLLTLGLLICG